MKDLNDDKVNVVSETPAEAATSVWKKSYFSLKKILLYCEENFLTSKEKVPQNVP